MGNSSASTSGSDVSVNSEGKFVSKEVPSEDLPKLVHKSSNNLQEEKERADLASANNPISWLMKWLRDLKKRQTTTSSFKLGVPLVALPIILVVLLTFIIAMSARTEKKEQLISTATPTPSPGSVYIMSKSGTLKVVKGDDEKEYFLVLPSGEAVKLEIPKSLDIDMYENKKVFVSGKYSALTGTLNVERFSDMEPSPTAIATPTTTPITSPTLETPSPEP